MKTEQNFWNKENGWSKDPSTIHLGKTATLVLTFASRESLEEDNEIIQKVLEMYPKAIHVGCSTAGEICDTTVYDNSVVVTGVQFEHTNLKVAQQQLNSMQDSYSIGEKLAKELNQSDLIHVLVLSDGLNVNGSALIKGMTDTLPAKIAVTGGLAGDGTSFKKTLLYFNNQKPEERKIIAIGFYGNRLKVGYGSVGGWDPYGPIRTITKSKGNILYEIDNKPALSTYKTYLGERAAELPSSALLFPLSLRKDKNDNPVVRTVLSVDEKNQSMTFAGEISEGYYAQFMKANFTRLVDGAANAAKTSYEAINSQTPGLAILISCVGRKLILQQRIEEETEAVKDILGGKTTMTGFYSYGEIAPFMPNVKCELHNQTMTITTFNEI